MLRVTRSREPRGENAEVYGTLKELEEHKKLQQATWINRMSLEAGADVFASKSMRQQIPN
jgi:hypothetical protein